MSIQSLLTILILFVIVAPARADTYHTVDYSCPLCSCEFSEKRISSYSTYGSFLDMKPISNARLVDPWTLPQCPDCSFVMLEDEYGAEELDSLKGFVKSGAFEKYSRHRSSRYALAGIFIFLGKPENDIGYNFLAASWDFESGSGVQLECLREAYAHYSEYMNTARSRDEEWETAMFICGELERRLGKFGESKTRFESMAEMEDNFKEIYVPLIQYELLLIREGVAETRKVPEGMFDWEEYEESKKSVILYAFLVFAFLFAGGGGMFIVLFLRHRRRKRTGLVESPILPARKGNR